MSRDGTCHDTSPFHEFMSRWYVTHGIPDQQCIVVTVEDSVLRTEMVRFESQEEDDPNRILFFKPMSWSGVDQVSS
jgi:hypothetical protein